VGTTQTLAIIGSGVLTLIVLELVRQRRFLERYALLWLGAAVVMVVLSVWHGALDTLADLLGISSPANALFLVAFGFVLVLLLNFSVVVSRLSDQSRVLAQRLALLEERVRRAERDQPPS